MQRKVRGAGERAARLRRAAAGAAARARALATGGWPRHGRRNGRWPAEEYSGAGGHGGGGGGVGAG